MGAWRDKYRQSESIDIKATIETSKCDKDIKLFYEKEKAKYQDNALGVLDYSKNISLHFQQQNSL
ncbi:PREDICTED: LOC110754858 isoform X2, partial [Prunus dulcis]